MPVDLNDWRHLVEQQIAWLADEGGQRRAWFGVGPETSSPDEDFCQFLDDARAEAFFARSDTGLNTTQIAEAYQGLDQKDREARFAELLGKVEQPGNKRATEIVS